jgi:hypothetical protein
MAIFERETKVSIPEIRIGETLVANFASLTQTINDDGGKEVITSERAEILWGATKESLIAAEDKKIAFAQRLITIKQAELVKAEEIKADLEALAVEAKP